jgi:hypothetical protein
VTHREAFLTHSGNQDPFADDYACEFRGHVARDSGKLSPGIPG